MGKGVVAAGGHYRSPAEGGTFPARTAFHWAGAGCPGGARPRARSPGCWAPPPGGWAALPAVQRVLGSRACSAPGAGDVEVVPGGRSGDGGGWEGAEAAGRLPSPHPPPRSPHLGPAGLFPCGRGFCAPLSGPVPAPFRAGGASRPPRRAVEVSAAAAGREGATAGCCRAASRGREPSARSRHLEPRQRAEVRVQGKGPSGSARGAQGARVRAWERMPGGVGGRCV